MSEVVDANLFESPQDVLNNGFSHALFSSCRRTSGKEAIDSHSDSAGSGSAAGARRCRGWRTYASVDDIAWTTSFAVTRAVA